MQDSLKQMKETKTVKQDNMVLIPGGKFLMGSDKFYPEEKTGT